MAKVLKRWMTNKKSYNFMILPRNTGIVEYYKKRGERMDRDKLLNDIGIGIIAFYQKEPKEFNDYADKLFDKDLYS